MSVKKVINHEKCIAYQAYVELTPRASKIVDLETIWGVEIFYTE